MAVIKTIVLEQYHNLCVQKALELGRVDFVVIGGLICEKQVEAFDVDGKLQFRFSPPTVRVATEHFEFFGELHLYEKELGVARGAFPWLEQVSDYLCLATGGAPVKIEPFRDSLSETHRLPENHPREILYEEVKVGRIITPHMLTRTNTFMHLAQHRIEPEKAKSYQRALWWFRHGANIEIDSPLLAYMSFFNSLEILLQNERSNRYKGKPKPSNDTKKQFVTIFEKELGDKLYQTCYGDSDNSLYGIRNNIDHGKIVELGSGILRVLKNMVTIKAVVVDLALYWIEKNSSVGGWISKGVFEHGSEGIIIISADEAQELGYKNSGSIIV